LTESRVRALVCPAGKKDVFAFDGDQRGLAVRVTRNAAAGSLASKVYYAQYSYGGAKRRVRLGAAEAISLGEARRAARAVLGEAAQGRDPASERKEAQVARKRRAARDALTVA
jgi:hypothetical protein